MSKMYFLPFRPAFDSAGVTVPGARHWFTVAGTNTPAAIYADAGLTTPLSNPLIANGVGYLPTVYLDPAVTYRIRIFAPGDEDENLAVGTPLEEYDPYVPALANSDILSDLADSGGASLIGYAGYAPGIIRSIQQILDEGLSLRKDFGALGDGTDQTAELQSALDAVIDTGGAPLKAPAGVYVITSGLTFDNSSETDRFTKRLRIVGDGRAHVQFKMFGVADTLLNYTGSLTNSESYLDLSGIRLSGDNTPGSRGFYLNTAAFASINDIVVEGFAQNVELLNVDQTEISNSAIRWGLKGLKIDTGTSTAANSIVLNNVAIGNNSTNGIDAADLNLFTMVGGSVQYNGTTGGGVTNFGVKLNSPGTSYGPIKFIGVAFEGNGGTSDLWIDSTSAIAAVSVDACGFLRATSTDYSTNFIRLDGTQVSTLSLSGSAFRHANDYVPNAARPYLAINNTAAVVKSDGSNLFGSATEAPTWYASRWPVTINSGVVHVHAGQIVAATTWNPPSLNAGDSATTTFAVTGAELGDMVIASFSTATTTQSLHAEVSSAGNVTVRLYNDTGGTLDVNGTVSVRVFKL